jgi:uncharacterized protein YjdB
MKKKLLFFIVGALVSFGAFAQLVNVPVANNSFTNPVYTGKVTNDPSIFPGWFFEGTVSNEGRDTKGFRANGDSLWALLHNKEGILRQVVQNEIIGNGTSAYKYVFYAEGQYSSEQGSFNVETYLGAKDAGGTITYFDSVLVKLPTANNVWGLYSATFVINPNSLYAGDTLVIGFRGRSVKDFYGEDEWLGLDSVTVAKTTITNVPLMNNSFTYPLDTATDSNKGKVTNDPNIFPGWTFEGTVNNEGRDGKGHRTATDSVWALLHNVEGKLRQVVKNTIIGTGTGNFKVNFSAMEEWGNGTPVGNVETYFGAKGLTDTIIYFDSTLVNLTASQYSWGSYSTTFNIPAGSAYNGDTLVVAFQVKRSDSNVNDNNHNLWAGLDSVVLTQYMVNTDHIDAINLTFANSNDSLEDTKKAIVYASTVPSYVLNQSVTWSISDSTIAKITAQGVLTADSLKTGNVTITGTSVLDPTKKGTIVITIFRRPVTSITITGIRTFDAGSTSLLTATVLPANATLKNLIWSVNDTTKASVDGSGLVTGKAKGKTFVTVSSFRDPTVKDTFNIVITENFIYQSVTIRNGGFELPNTGKIETFWNDTIPYWLTRDSLDKNDYNGVEIAPLGGKWAAYESTASTGIWQIVDTIPTQGSKCLISYKARQSNNDTAGFDGTVVYLYHYKPGTPYYNGSVIDSFTTLLAADQSIIVLIKAPISIPANSFKNDSLVIRFKANKYDHAHHIKATVHYQTDGWIDIDDISMQELVAVVPATSLSVSFELSTNSINVGSSGICSANFVPGTTTFQKVTWSVSDASIATIDASGNLTGVKAGTVIVTATSIDDPTIFGTLTITVTPNVGVPTILAAAVKAYPNPSNGEFTLEAPVNSEVSVMDITGKLIYSTVTTVDKSTISIGTSGIYLLKVKTNGSVLINKIIVK